MVDTIDPVSTKQETVAPLNKTLMFGQDDINPAIPVSFEPKDFPSERWLGSSVGFSFPPGERNGWHERSTL